MKCLNYTIETLSPVIITKNSGDKNTVETFDFIPGTNILGLFAHKYILKNPSENVHKDEKFYRLFLSGNVKYLNAYPALATDRVNSCFLLPFSIQAEKNADESCAKFFDKLFYERDKTGNEVQMKAAGGFGSFDSKKLSKHSVRKTINFHHQRDEKTGTSEKGKIYNYESIDEKQLFKGYILGEENELNEITALLNNEKIFRIGLSKNAQYGKISMEFAAEMNDFFSEVESFKEQDLSIINDEISLTFLSNVIINNENGFSACRVADLEKYLKELIDQCISIKKDKIFLKTQPVEGYSSVWKMKKCIQNSYMAGSCFILTGVSEGLKNKLIDLQKHGIGEKTSEGFGRIIFGLQKNKELNGESNANANKQNNISKPEDSSAPQIVKEIALKIYNNQVMKITAGQAIDNLAKAENWNIKTSQVGKLEMFAKSSENQDQFKAKLTDLRKPTKDQLTACRMAKENLYEFLTEFDVSSILPDFKNLNSAPENDYNQILNICGLKLSDEDINKLKNEAFRHYFTMFFGVLRKKIKIKSKAAVKNEGGK